MAEQWEWINYRTALTNWFDQTIRQEPETDALYNMDILLTGQHILYNTIDNDLDHIRVDIHNVINTLADDVDDGFSISDDDIDTIVNNTVNAVQSNTVYNKNLILDALTVTQTALELKVSDSEGVITATLETLDTNLHNDILINGVKLDEIIDSITDDSGYDLSDIHDSINDVTDILLAKMQTNADDIEFNIIESQEDFFLLLSTSIADLFLETTAIGQTLYDQINIKTNDVLFNIEALKGFISTEIDDIVQDLDIELTNEIWLLEANLFNGLNRLEANLKTKIDNAMAIDNITKIMTTILHTD